VDAGDYVVEVYVDPAFGVHDRVRYLLRHDEGETEVELDHGAASGWASLGTYTFAAGGGQHLDIYDHATGTVPADARVVADAVRLVPAMEGMGAEPVEMLDDPDEIGSFPVDVEGDLTLRGSSCAAGGKPEAAHGWTLAAIVVVAGAIRRRGRGRGRR
jgi:hypothetical protein